MDKPRQWTLQECDASEKDYFIVLGDDGSSPTIQDYDPCDGSVIPVKFIFDGTN